MFYLICDTHDGYDCRTLPYASYLYVDIPTESNPHLHKAKSISMINVCRRLPGRLALVMSLLTLPVAKFAAATTLADADAAFAALNKVYWNEAARFYRLAESGDKKAPFWLEAQLWDTVMDQYDRSGSTAARKQIDVLYDGFMADYPDWTTNKYNDDIIWWSIACTRAYRITHNARYLNQAKASFDFVYKTFHDDTLGGGIWWSSDRRSKNSCIEGPAVIAAVRLAELLDRDDYLDKAKAACTNGR